MRLFSSLLFLVAWVRAHNWMVSPSRVPFAATIFPCMPPRTNLPHVQVAQGQEFQMEWSTGHDRNVYFVLLKKSDADKLAEDSERKLDEYIAGSTNLMNGHWAKKHRTNRADNDGHVLGGTVAQHYSNKLVPGNGEYLARPAQFGPELNMWTYRSYPNDAYVAYNSQKYPWMLAAWRFEIQEADPNEWDVALFKIPSAFTTNGGDFIIHYLWSGYYDCIDINVQPTGSSLPYPYGKPINGSESIRSNRIDHCVFDNPQQYTTWPRPVISDQRGAALGCVQKCKYWYESGCGGVTVFPLSLLSRNDFGSHWNSNNNLLRDFYNTPWEPYNHFSDGQSDGVFNVEDGIPWDVVNGDYYGNRLWRIFRPESFGPFYVNVRSEPFLELRPIQENKADWTCVLTNPRTPTTTVDKMTVTDDPLDPVFYSTCWEVIEALEFIGISVQANTFSGDIPYTLVGGKCISCNDAKAYSDESYAPMWEMSARCEYCERDKPNIAGTDRIPAMAKKCEVCGLGWPDLGNSDACFKWFEPGDFHSFYGTDNNNRGFMWPSEHYYDWTVELCADTVRQHNSVCQQSVMLFRPANNTGPFVYPDNSWYTQCGCLTTSGGCSTSLMQTSYASWALTDADARLWITELWDIQPVTPDPTCATGVLNAAGNFCCKGPCSGGCKDDPTEWSVGRGAFCHAGNTPAYRLCSEWGPPCRIA